MTRYLTSRFLRHSLCGLFGLSAVLHAYAGGTYVEKYKLPVVGQTAPNGAWPKWELTSDGVSGFYGVTPSWGSNKGGVLFSLSTAGVYQKLRDFGPAGDLAGSSPDGPLLRVGGIYYGVTSRGGANDKGVLYAWSASTSPTYQVLAYFGGGVAGANPSGPLTLAKDGNIYGTTQAGGSCSQGTVFRYAPTTATLTVLHSFCGTEGSQPITGVIQATDGNLYGTTNTGGFTNAGTLFKVTTAGDFTQLAVFGQLTNDPQYPSRLVQGKDGNLYGTSYRGGDGTNKGTVFSSTLSGVISVRAIFVNANTFMANPATRAALIERFVGVFYGVTDGQNGGNVYQFKLSDNSISNIKSFDSYGAAMWPETGLTLGIDGNLWGNTTDGENLYVQRAGSFYSIQNLVAN